MRRTNPFHLALLLLAMAMTPEVALAADEADHASDHAAAASQHADGVEHFGAERSLVPSPSDAALWWEMLWTVVVFGLFFTVLSVLVWPKILKALRDREDKQRGDLHAAEQANAEAKRLLADYEAKLREAHAESRKLLDQARADADDLRAQLKADTDREMASLRQRAADDINRAKQAALQDLYAHSAELATAVAAKILQRQVTESDTQRLVEQSLNELNQRKAG